MNPNFDLGHVRNMAIKMCDQITRGETVMEGAVLAQILACQVAVIDHLLSKHSDETDSSDKIMPSLN